MKDKPPNVTTNSNSELLKSLMPPVLSMKMAVVLGAVIRGPSFVVLLSTQAFVKAESGPPDTRDENLPSASAVREGTGRTVSRQA